MRRQGALHTHTTFNAQQKKNKGIIKKKRKKLLEEIENALMWESFGSDSFVYATDRQTFRE